MKIRSGFVSNSSSSSFMAVVEKDAFEQMKKTLSPMALAVLNEIGVNNTQAFGKDCIVYEVMHGNYSWTEWVDRNRIGIEATRIAAEQGKSLADLGSDEWQNLYDAEHEVSRKLTDMAHQGLGYTHSMDF